MTGVGLFCSLFVCSLVWFWFWGVYFETNCISNLVSKQSCRVAFPGAVAVHTWLYVKPCMTEIWYALKDQWQVLSLLMQLYLGDTFSVKKIISSLCLNAAVYSSFFHSFISLTGSLSSQYSWEPSVTQSCTFCNSVLVLDIKGLIKQNKQYKTPEEDCEGYALGIFTTSVED